MGLQQKQNQGFQAILNVFKEAFIQRKSNCIGITCDCDGNLNNFLNGKRKQEELYAWACTEMLANNSAHIACL